MLFHGFKKQMPWYFHNLSSMPGIGRFRYQETYTLDRSFDRWVEFRFNSLGSVTTGHYVVERLPLQSRLYRPLVAPGGFRICRCACISHRCFPLLSCLCMRPAPSQGRAGMLAAAAPIVVQPLGLIGTVLFYGTATMNLAHGNASVGKPLKEETSRNSTQLTGFTLWTLAPLHHLLPA